MIAVLWGALLCPLFFVRQLPLAMLFLGVAGASWAPYTPMETTLLQRLVAVEIRGQVFGARHSLVVAAPLGAAFGGVLPAISLGATGDRYLWPRLHPRRAGWPRLTVTASVATRKPLVFRQGMNAGKEISATWMGSFPSIRVHLRSSVAKNEC
jgi:hypothetical protein